MSEPAVEETVARLRSELENAVASHACDAVKLAILFTAQQKPETFAPLTEHDLLKMFFEHRSLFDTITIFSFQEGKHFAVRHALSESERHPVMIPIPKATGEQSIYR